MKQGFIIIGTNIYSLLALRLIKSLNYFYKGSIKPTFYCFTDIEIDQYLSNDIDIKTYKATHKNWNEGTNSKYKLILFIADQIDTDYLFYIDADTSVYKDIEENFFWGDVVGAQHFLDYQDEKPFERNPISTAYVPRDTTLKQMLFMGAFWGGKTSNVIDLCKTLSEYQDNDALIPFEAGCNDESYLNKHFHYNPPSKIIPIKDFPLGISCKGGIGDTRQMEYDIDNYLAMIKDNVDKRFALTDGVLNFID